MWALLRREGWPVNNKRVHRLWRKEGLKVPQKQCKRRRLLLGESENGCTRRQPEHKDHVWSYDFVMDLTEDDRRLNSSGRVHKGVPEHRCRAFDHRRRCGFDPRIPVSQRGEPAFIRSDNGPEFIAKTVKQWLEASEVETLYIEPGSPWENAYSETFISCFSDELLKREVFADLLEAKAARSVIARFGRHPHRNEILGGTSTPEELECLRTETPPHLRRPPS